MAVQLLNPTVSRPSLISTAGIPTRDQYAMIERLAPVGSEPLPREDWCVFPVLANCNLISRGRERFALSALQQQASMLPGTPLLFDHAWDEVEDSAGLNIDAQLLRIPPVSSIQMTDFLGRAGYFELNQKIVAREGFVGLIVQIAICNPEIIYSVQSGVHSRVSIGGFSMTSSWFCPDCGLPLSHPNCPHTLPGYGAMTGMPECSYLEIQSMADMVELSLVSVPKMPGMSVISAGHWINDALFGDL